MKKTHGEKHIKIESTQSTLKERLKESPTLEHGYYVMAESQTAGRGRSDHAWESLGGNLHVSVLLKKIPFIELTWVPLWISVCVHQALSSLEIEPSLIQLKWPNDLWIDERKKIGGILCEKVGDFIVAGIGINLTQAPKNIEGSGALSEISEPILAGDLLDLILVQLSKPMKVSEVRAYYEKFALIIQGDRIQWLESLGQQSGLVIGLGEFGELQVKVENNTRPLFSETVSKVNRS